jgi:hypothetical protein
MARTLSSFGSNVSKPTANMLGASRAAVMEDPEPQSTQPQSMITFGSAERYRRK